MRSRYFASFLCGITLGLASAVALADRPPAGAKALPAVLEAVEQNHPGVVISAEFDDRRWTVVTCAGEGRSCRELAIDPVSGKELRWSSQTAWGRGCPAR